MLKVLLNYFTCFTFNITYIKSYKYKTIHFSVLNCLCQCSTQGCMQGKFVKDYFSGFPILVFNLKFLLLNNFFFIIYLIINIYRIILSMHHLFFTCLSSSLYVVRKSIENFKPKRLFLHRKD